MIVRASRALSALSALGIAVACVTTKVTPAGDKVRVTSSQDAVAGCKLLGEVIGADHMNGGLAGQGAAEENAPRRLKNEAAAMGADPVLVVPSTPGMSGSTLRGAAYRCGAQAPSR